jgi:hypothetical protein
MQRSSIYKIDCDRTAKLINCKDLVRVYKKHDRKGPMIGDGVCRSVKRKRFATQRIVVKQSQKKDKLDSVSYQVEIMDLGGSCFVLEF